MEKFRSGFSRATLELIEGFLASILVTFFAGMISSLANRGVVPFYSIWFFHLIILSINIHDQIVFIQEVRYWAPSYNLAWIVGAIINANLGLLSIPDMVISIIIPIVFLTIRVWRWRRGS